MLIIPEEAGKLLEGLIIVDELIKLTKTEQGLRLIIKLVEETMKSYEKGMKRRKFVNTIIFDMLFQLSPQDIAIIVQNKLVNSLEEFKSPSHEAREKFMRWIDEKFVELKSDSALQEKIENWKAVQLKEGLELHTKIAEAIKNIRENNLKNSSSVNNLTEKIEGQIDKLIEEFQVNLQWQNKLDYKVKGILLEVAHNNHSKIGIMVKENLNKFSNDMIVNLIETKVGNDLQIIRINGSVVGGFVGMAVFLLTFWI